MPHTVNVSKENERHNQVLDKSIDDDEPAEEKYIFDHEEEANKEEFSQNFDSSYLNQDQ